MLPDITPVKRDAVAERYLERQTDLTDAQRGEIRGAVMGVLTDARFAEAFGPNSRAEVALAGQNRPRRTPARPSCCRAASTVWW